MSDADGGPSTSRSTRRSGGNSPRVTSESPAMGKTEADGSSSREQSLAHSGTPQSRTKKTRGELEILNTPSYGGNLFTAPTSRKRETKKNSRFSPDIVLQKKHKSAADKLHEAAAAFEEKPKQGRKRTVLNLKDTVGKLCSMRKNLVESEFDLPPMFGGKGAELNRRLPKEQWGGGGSASTPAKQVVRRSSTAAGSRASPVSSQASDFPATVDFEGASTSSSQPKKRSRSSPAGGRKTAAIAKAEAVADHPQRGRRKKKESDEGEIKNEPRKSRGGRLKKTPVKDGMMEYSDIEEPQEENEEMEEEEEMEQAVKKGRKSRTLPPPLPFPPSSAITSTGRRNRGEVMNVMLHEIKTEPLDYDESAEMGEISEMVGQPSPSAEDRSRSRKRGRQPRSAKEDDSVEQSMATEPRAKRKNTRRSTRSTVDEEEMEEMDAEERITNAGRHRNRRSANQLLTEDRREGEKTEEGETEEGGMVTRRRSFRGRVEETADGSTMTPTKMTTRGAAKTPMVTRKGARMDAGKDAHNYPGYEVIAPLLNKNQSNDLNDEGNEEREEEENDDDDEEDTVPLRPSLSMLMDESTAEKSGNEEDSFPELEGGEAEEEETTKEGEEGEEQATPARRGRGRPRKDGMPFKTTVRTPRTRVEREVVEPIPRQRRSVAPNPKMADYITEVGTRSARRVSAGASQVLPRALAAAGVSLDLPTSPPIPEVMAAPGSALSIMRAFKKKKLPSMRSPSPPFSTTKGRGGCLSSLAAATTTLADAPPLLDAAADVQEEEKEEEEEQPGPSRVPVPSARRQRRSDESAAKPDEKEKDVAVERRKEEASVDHPRLVDYSSSSNSSQASQPTQDESQDKDIVWITPECIRGKRITKRFQDIVVKKEPEDFDFPSEVPIEEKEKEEDDDKEEEEGNEGREEEEGDEEENAAEGPSNASQREETAETAHADVFARWNEVRRAVDEERAKAGQPPLPLAPPPAALEDGTAAPLASRATRRSIQAPARFGDYDFNFGDVRKRSATIGSPSTLHSPALVETKRRRKRKGEDESQLTPTKETPAAAADEGAADDADADDELQYEQPSGSRQRSRTKKDKRPRIVLKFKLGRAAAAAQAAAAAAVAVEVAEEQPEEGEEMMDDDEMGEMEPSSSSAVVQPKLVPTPRQRRDRKDRRRPRKSFIPKWKHRPVPHMGFIELDGKAVESVTLTVAGVIDSMLLEICNDGILKSTLSMKEQASEISRHSTARRRALGLIPPPLPPGAARPKPPPLVIQPREERTKRIRHAPLSKEYDNLMATASALPLEQVNTTSFHALAGMSDRKPAERRRESRHENTHRKLSLAVSIDQSYAEAEERVETPPVKPKKQKKREREREEVVNKNAITYTDLMRSKAHKAERLPGRILTDPADFFYRELFTDDPDSLPSPPPLDLDDLDVMESKDPLPDDLAGLGPAPAFGFMASETAKKLLAVLPRPLPFPDEDDDSDEEREWTEEDLKRAVSHHSMERRNLVEKALRVINSQRMVELAVQGTKGAQDVLHNSYVKHACQLREHLPIYTEDLLADACWLHRSLLRLLPEVLLPVYLEMIRFIRHVDPKGLATSLSKGLNERGVDPEWDALFEKEQTDDDRTQPMLNGSQPASASVSDATIAAYDDSAAADDVTATMEAVLKILEEAHRDAAETAAAAAEEAEPATAAASEETVEGSAATSSGAEAGASPDSDQGGLVIDEDPEGEQQPAVDAAAAAAAESMETGMDGDATAAASVAPQQPVLEMSFEEEVFVDVEDEIKKKPRLESITEIVAEVTEKKVRDANTDPILNSINTLELGDVIPILIAPVFDMEDPPEDFSLKNRPHEYMFRLIRYATPSPGEFKPIRPRIPAGEISVAEAMDAALEYVANAVKAAVKNKGNSRVVLFGWGLSCYINLRLAQTLHGISAIVNFAFPMKTLDGWRGTPDDDICLTYCPCLFVVGAGADDFDPVEMLMMRQNMIQSPGLLVIGEADAQLNISSVRLNRERITQKIAARMILEQVIKFINLPANQLERAKLVPLQLNNVYFVEPIAVKNNFSTAEAHQAALVPGAGKKPTAYLPAEPTGMTAAQQQSFERRRQQQLSQERKRKRSRLEEQTTAAGRLAQSIAYSAAPISKRARTDELPPLSTTYGGRITGDHTRFSMPITSPLASPSLHSPGFMMRSRPAILSHSSHHHSQSQQYHYPQPQQLFSPQGAPSTSAAASSSSSGLLLQTTTTRPANAAPPPPSSPRGPLDPASISLS